MNKSHLATQLKALRNQKGMSQGVLAEASGLSLRTIQRIENGETNPTGDSLKRLSHALNVNPDELIDWNRKENKKYLIFLNLSALTFLFFPLLGILVPFILWTNKKDKIKNIDRLGKHLINFEITWTLLLFLIPFILFISSKFNFLQQLTFGTIFSITGCLYLFNLVFVLYNTLRINNKQDVIYYPQIKFLKN